MIKDLTVSMSDRKRWNVVHILIGVLGVHVAAFFGILYEWVSLWHGAQDIASYAAPSYGITPGFTEIRGWFSYQQFHNPVHLSVLPLTIINVLLVLSGIGTLAVLCSLTRLKPRP